MTAHDMQTREMSGDGTPTTVHAPGAYPESAQQPARGGDHRSRGADSGRPTRWGPAWTGALVAVPVFVVLQLLFTALGWLSVGVDGPGSGAAASIVSAVLAIIALFVGGLAGGTASGSHAVSADAALQGAMTWALAVVGLLVLGAVGGGVLAGSLGTVGSLGGAVTVDAVQSAAGWAALWLGVAAVAAIAGSIVGARGSGAAQH
ncbi:hypothetical protein [Actinomycetospora lemnae]|uniref:Major facilitator superfamily (MFS) profile domain-containing protein n=1 Tax=Actinomycetospora lemnae TaxID=3019891 RepID=A0ABT5SMF7_9PSEU|nr:hypothetical protein [Actinomycetospora sp. DW7H6]MDD7964013.1 hypothetical protein [Actinomycetospora sp. DW7H6]